MNRGVVHSMIQKLWNFGGMVVTFYLGSNTFSISTNSADCFHKILEESSWHFMGKLFNINEWNSQVSFEDIDMSTAEFWVQVHNLLPDYMTAENVGSHLGKVVKFEESIYNGVMI